jgi:hypothetical protein
VREFGKTFPLEPHRVRRDFGRFCALVEAITFLHQHQRARVTIEGVEYLRASTVDYSLAVQLAKRVFEDTIFEVSAKSRGLLAHMIANQWQEDAPTPKTKKEFTQAALVAAMGWKRSSVQKWLYPLIENGYITQIVEEGQKGGKGKASKYIVANKELEAMIRLAAPSAIAEQFPDCAGVEYEPFFNKREDDDPPPV